MSGNYRVLIIGAGASGYAAACRFLEKGLQNFLVLEASNRIGGRINTVDFGDGKIEMGAQWCHGEKGNVVFDLVKDLNILENSHCDYKDFLFVDSKGKTLCPKETKTLVKLIFDIAGDKEEKSLFSGSLGEYVTSRFWNGLKDQGDQVNRKTAAAVLEWYHQFENSVTASKSWWETPCQSEYEECEGNSTLNWGNRGFATIFSVLDKSLTDSTNTLPVKEKIAFGKEAMQILYSESGAWVTCKDGSEYQADHVIVTVSLGVLKERHRAMFVPELPSSKILAIEALGINPINKIFLLFPEAWWPADSIGFSFVWCEEDRGATLSAEFSRGPVSEDGRSWLEDIIGFFPVEGNPRVLLGWVLGPLTTQIESMPEDLLIDGCSFLFDKFLGEKYKITRPTQVLSSTWGSNPLFRGSYSFQTLCAAHVGTSAVDLQAPLAGGTLLFAGEATHPKYHSTVHGAIEAGVREANRILDNAKPEKGSPLKRHCQIAIVGAGLAGLGAAHELMDSFCQDFLILEAKEAPGGRASTIYLEDGSHLDMGAQWLHGDRSELWMVASKHDLLSHGAPVREALGNFYRPGGEIVNSAIVDGVAKFVADSLEDCERWKDLESGWPASVGEHLDTAFSARLAHAAAEGASHEKMQLLQELFDWHVQFQVIDNACSSLQEVSARDWGIYSVPCDGTEHSHDSLTHGLGSLIKVLADRVPSDRLLLKTPVRRVLWGDKGARLLCFDGSEVTADCVLVTVSLGVLKECMDDMFRPALPEQMSQTIRALGFGTICKIFLQFDKPWWDADGIQLVWPHDEPEHWTRHLTGFDVVANRSDTLVGWVGERGELKAENLSDEQIGKQCVQILRRFTGRCDIPDPIKTVRTAWRSDCWTRGAYSHTTRRCDAYGLGPADLCTPVTNSTGYPVLLLAGEACHPTQYSTAHGAFSSGCEQARVLLAGLDLEIGPSLPRSKM